MKRFYLLFLLITTAGCQIDVMDPARAKTVVPDTEAKIARKLYLDSKDERVVRSEERYKYRDDGKLERRERLNYDEKGNGRMYSYDAYSYNPAGQPTEITSFALVDNGGNFQPTQMRMVSYPTQNRTVEQLFYRTTANGGSWNSIQRHEKETENGRLHRVYRYGINDRQQFVVQSSELYVYEADRLVAVETRNGSGQLLSTSRYSYKGRTATVDLLYPASTEARPIQYLQFDRRGRLIRQRNNGYYSPYLYLSGDYSLVAITDIAFEYID